MNKKNQNLINRILKQKGVLFMDIKTLLMNLLKKTLNK